MYHIEKGDYANKYWHYENNLISTYIYKSIGILCIPFFVSYCCHGDILVFNRSLTEYEISWVKNNMMCSKQQEPDIDL